MSRTAPGVDLRPDHWVIVCSILRQHVPDREVLAFGSRATWTAKDYSDLDLAIMGDEPLSPDATSALAERFSGSDLPFKVDLVDWARIDDGFRGIIRRHGVAVQTPKRVRNAVDAKRRSWSTSMSSATKGEWRESTWGDEIALEYGKARRGHDTNTGSFRVFGSNGLIGWTDAALAPGPGVVLGRKGAYRGVTYSPDPFFVIDTAYYVVSKSKHDMRWLFYAIKHYKLGEIDDGSPIPSTTRAAVYPCELAVPPLAEQRAIAHILGTLDDKIELNRRMNETLEAMARALFKSWFVDFDPVRAKMEGRDTGLPQEIAELFPDRLVDSEMGEIPEGWPVGTLGDIATSSRSGIDPAKTASAIPYIGLQHMPRRSVALMDWGRAGSVSSNKFAFKNGDILFGKLRPYFHKVGIAPVNGICSTDIVVLEARMPNWSAFVLVCVSSSRFVAYTSQTSTGTKMPRTSWRTMSRYELCQPTDAIATGFQQVVSPMLERIVANVHESRTLGVLRDALVPKLVSGELRVRDAERLVGAVG